MDSIEYLSQKKIIKKGIFHTKSILHDERKQKLHEDLLFLYETGLIKELRLIDANPKNNPQPPPQE